MSILSDDELEKIHENDIVTFKKIRDANLIPELERYRTRDEWASIYGGAVLGFSGIMLAADFVVLSAGPETLLGIEKSLWGPVGPGGLGLLAGILFFCSAIAAFGSFTAGYDWPTRGSAKAYFGEYTMYIQKREFWTRVSAQLAISGCALLAVSIGWNSATKLFR